LSSKYEFWITNISQTYDVSLADLRLTIRRGESRNLLDGKHYSYTLEQLQKSAESGSIKTKSKVIKVRDVPPKIIAPGRYVVAKNAFVRAQRVPDADITKPTFEDLDFLDDVEAEQFAAADADIEYNDNVPALSVDKKFKKDDD